MLRYTEASKILSEELEAEGYVCRLENGHAHPRFYVGVNGEERFTPLSSTSNYDQGNLLNMKRQDIRRDILPHLPKPEVVEKSKETFEFPTMDEKPIDNRVFAVKTFIMGRGIFVVQVPVEAIPSDKKYATPMLFGESKRLYLLFSAKDGKLPSPTKSPGLVAYRFSRTEVTFKYAENSVPGYKAPDMCARLKDNSLVCDDPLPMEILLGKTKLYQKGDKVDLNEGKELRAMLNEWIEAAERSGLEPKVSVEKNRVFVQVAVKVKQEL